MMIFARRAPSVGVKRLLTLCLQINDLQSKGQRFHLSSAVLLFIGPTEVAAFSRDWLHLRIIFLPIDICTFVMKLFFSQRIFLPVLIAQQSAWICNWILFHPSELQTQVKKSSFSWQLFASCKRYLTEPVSEMWFEKFDIISNNVNINIDYQEFLWRAVCHDSRLGFSWKEIFISFSK